MENYGFGRKSGELYKKWPRTEGGEPVAPRFLVHCSSLDMADTLTIGMLEAYGIPAVVLHPGDGDFAEVLMGMSGTGSSIYVPETLYEEAKSIMEAEPDDELQS